MRWEVISWGTGYLPKKLQGALENGDCFQVQVSYAEKGAIKMNQLNREVLRMELQISELIRIVANLNERLKKLEDIGDEGMCFSVPRYPEKI